MQFKPTLIASAVFLAGSGIATAQDVQVVKIGHVAPLSGPQAHLGKDMETAARMAIDDLNAQNITIGGKKTKWELVPEDDASDPKQGTAVAQKLCDAKVAGVAGHLNSGTTIPASKVYHGCGIPHVTGAATNPDLSKPGYDTTYRIIANDKALGAGLALYAKSHGVKRVAVIDDRTAYGQGVAEVFRDVAKQNGIEVVAQEFTTDKATDFMAILTSIRGKKPDAIMFGGMDAQAGPMLRQIEQLGMGSVKYFGGDGICTTELPKLAANAKVVGNVVCAEGGASIAKMPKGQEWRKRYDAKYPGVYKIYGPYVYDVVMVLADAMKRANSIDPKVYIPLLKKTDYKGVTANIRFDAHGELINPAITLHTFKAGAKTALN